MKRGFFTVITLAVFSLIAISCAKEVEESSMEIQQKVLDAYIEVNYPGKKIETTSNGTKILSRTEGTGTKAKKFAFVYVNITTKDLSGNIVSTNSEELSKKLNTYKNTNYYGPKLYFLGTSGAIIGVEELLYNMKEGGRIEAIIPPWASNYEYSQKSYTNTTNLIYEIELISVIDDIMKYENNNLQEFSNRHFGGIDSTKGGFYFKKLYENTPVDSITSSTSVNVRYIGKLLDGFVFDTNIRDSAKRYGIYDASKSYDALAVSLSNNEDKVDESNSLVKGFSKAVSLMNYGDRAVTFFNSDWGYTSKGSNQIPAYAPLYFYIYVEPKE